MTDGDGQRLDLVQAVHDGERAVRLRLLGAALASLAFFVVVGGPLALVLSDDGETPPDPVTSTTTVGPTTTTSPTSTSRPASTTSSTTSPSTTTASTTTSTTTTSTSTTTTTTTDPNIPD